MRLIKMLGLAVVAMSAVMAFMGASMASAVHLPVLCHEEPKELCKPGQLFAAGTIIHGVLEPLESGGKKELHAVLLGSINELCSESKVLGTITKSSPVEGEITAVSFASCSPCTTVTMEGLPYKVKIVHDLTGLHLWLMHITGNIKAKFSCPLGVTCVFETKEVHLDAKNTATGPLILTLENVLTRVSGSEFFCGNEGKWDANYTTTCLEPANTTKACWLALDEKEA